ncbi:MAG TPA: hypothetical protein VF149_04490, partial [Bacillales bacterium]
MRKSIVILSLMLLVLAGCSNTEPTVTDDLKEKLLEGYVHTYKNEEGQTFHIISGYKRVYQYAKAVEENPDQSDLWRKKVTDPLWDKCFKNGQYLGVINQFMSAPSSPNLGLVEKQAVEL